MGEREGVGCGVRTRWDQVSGNTVPVAERVRASMRTRKHSHGEDFSRPDALRSANGCLWKARLCALFV